jgi:hypothetical protein
MPHRRLILTLLCAAALPGLDAAAVVATMSGATTSSGSLDRTLDGDAVSVKLSSPFTALPPGGCAPFHVNIRNDGDYGGSWQLGFAGDGNGSSLGSTSFEQVFSVPAKATGSFDILVPLPVVGMNPGGTNLTAEIRGPGFPTSNYSPKSHAYFYMNTGAGTRSPFTLIGKELAGPTAFELLQTFYTDKGEVFNGSSVNAVTLPSDWRAYSGVASVFLKDADWLQLNAGQHDALCDYVAQGGQLLLFSDNAAFVPSPPAGAYGFGAIQVVPLKAAPPSPSDLYDLIQGHHATSAFEINHNFTDWPLQSHIGIITVSNSFIVGFVLLFAIVVGPVNLFVFARGSHRFRLFWTTPLISITASLALMVGILVTDGVGGVGRQMIAIFSLPDSNREVVVQEQVARTAVLFSSHWHNGQNYLVTPISSHVLASWRPHGHHSALDDGSSNDTYHYRGNELSGQWFRSRAIEGQYLQATRPSRSCLTVLNVTALEQHYDPPVILSSFPDQLDKVFVIDLHGNYWKCDHLGPGEKKTCQSAMESEYQLFWNHACAEAGGKLKPMLQASARRPGTFYATAQPSDSEVLATLPDIRWHVASGVYLGSWVAASATETGP